MDLQILQITKVDSAWDCCQMLIVIQLLKTLGGILEKVFIYTTLVGRCTLSVLVTAASLFRVGTATFTMASIPPPSVRSPAAAASRFLTIRSLLSFWLSQSTMDSRLCMSSPRCVPFEWALSRAGEQSTTDRTSPVLPAGLRFTSTGLCSGWIKSLLRWALRWTPFLLFHSAEVFFQLYF